MSIWGKVGGLAAGMAVGGPMVGVLGMIAGHFLIDKALEDPEVTFTIAVIALCAKMARSDGEVQPAERAVFEKVFRVPEEERAHVRRFFDFARRDSAGFEFYARQIARLYAGNRYALEDVLDGLFLIAKADNQLHPAEEAFLKQVTEIFGLSQRDYRRLRATHFGPDPSDPYAVLGLEETATSAEVKDAYRALVRENHPDQLIARGVPAEFVKLASDKMAAINDAYNLILAERAAA